MQMEVYYSKTADLCLVTSPDGIIMAKADSQGKPKQPEMVYDDSLDNVMHEYARLGIDDWVFLDTVEIKDNNKQ
jgi:hypothetical protein